MLGPKKNALPHRVPETNLAIAVATVLLLCLSGCRRHEAERTAPPPRDANVLLITLDTTRADHLSCYGPVAPVYDRRPGSPASAASEEAPVIDRRYSYAKTPNLDALAARGVRFIHAVSQVPLTLPSHACIFTGTYPEVHGLRDMGGFVLDPRQVTLATMAKQAGFRTAAFVGSKAVGRHFGLQQGFEVYDDQMTSGDLEGQLPGIFPERRAAVTTDHALDWLKLHAEERFFLWVHFYDPHEPYDPPEPYKTRYANDPYSGEIAYTDEQAGRLLEFLDQRRLRERTLVVVMGDHGESLGSHGEMTHGIFIYDDTVHVPLIVAGPEIPAAKTLSSQARLIDVLPTIAEFLGLPPKPDAQGVSLWSLIRHNQPVIGQGANYAYIETLYPKTYMNWSELRGMRTDQWKFILAPQPELYDLERDPQEKENVIKRHPAEADQLQKKIWEVIGPPGQNQNLAYAPVSRESQQELASLGYVSGGTSREIVLNMSGPDPKERVAMLRAMEESGGLMKRKAYGQAARVMEAALRSDPSNPTARIYLATAYERQRDWRHAIQTYQAAMEKGRTTDLILARLGKAYLRVGELAKGIEALEKASRLDPSDLDTLRNLGTVYLQLGRVEESEKAFRAITVQDDHYAAAYNGLGLVAILRGEANTAQRQFERAIEVGPDEPEPLLNLGLLCQKTGNKQGAIRYYERFLEKAPRDQYPDQIAGVREALHELRGGQ
jgi:arylsulfatase A-like enzyme/Tfp pilus assembly protein PilF